MIENLQYLSIILEGLIAVIGLMIAIKKKKAYGWGFFITFAIYVFYDLTGLIPIELSSNILYPLFFIATLSALYAVLGVYKNKR